MQIHSLHSARD